MKRNTLLCISLLAVLTFNACKQGAIEPVPDLTVDDITHYFWHDTTSPQTFVGDDGSATNKLTFTAAHNGFGVNDASNTNYSPLAFDVSSSQIMGSGFKPGSIIDLDPYSHFTSLDTVVESTPKFITAVLGSKGYIASTDQGVWSSASGAWLQDQVSVPMLPLSLLSYDAGSGLTYGASSNAIYYHLAASPGKWSAAIPNAPAGPYTALLAFGGALYVAPASGGVYKYSGSWTQISGISELVTGLYPFADVQKVLVGTQNGNCFTISYSSNAASPLRIPSGMGRINCFQSFPVGMAIGTDLGLFWNKNFTDPTSWVHLYDKGPISSLAQRSGSSEAPLIGCISNQKVLYIDTNKTLHSIAPQPGPALEFIPTTSSILTPTQIDSYSGHWSVEADSIQMKFYAAPDGSLTMLRSDATSKDKTWRAGTLVTERERRSYAFTGRVLDHLDKLTINGKDYPDVLQVRYSDEMQDTIPSWTVYYQYKRGPIMVTKSKTVSGHTSVLSKHVNN